MIFPERRFQSECREKIKNHTNLFHEADIALQELRNHLKKYNYTEKKHLFDRNFWESKSVVLSHPLSKKTIARDPNLRLRKHRDPFQELDITSRYFPKLAKVNRYSEFKDLLISLNKEFLGREIMGYRKGNSANIDSAYSDVLDR